MNVDDRQQKGLPKNNNVKHNDGPEQATKRLPVEVLIVWPPPLRLSSKVRLEAPEPAHNLGSHV